MIKQLEKGKARLIVSIGSGDTRRKLTKTVTYTTKKELKRLYDDFEREARQNPTSDITVKELIDAHISHAEAIGRKPETIRGYRICEKRISPALTRLKAKEVSTFDIEKEIARMSRKRLSAKTIKNTIGLISAAYRHAIKTKQLKENPCQYATLPKGENKEVRILHRNEIQDFVYAISNAPLDDKVAYELALFLGLRRSEILGLKESDVDIVSGMISVHNTRHRVDGVDYDSDTKTERSTRVLALPDILIMDIARLLEVHRNFKYESVDYLIQDGFGGIYTPQTLTQRLYRLQRDNNLPFVSLHKLRHTYASLLHESGIDMVQISRELGHSNLSTTMNIYTHILKTPSQSSREIAATINLLGVDGQKEREK